MIESGFTRKPRRGKNGRADLQIGRKRRAAGPSFLPEAEVERSGTAELLSSAAAMNYSDEIDTGLRNAEE
jgi:hypothetical protein